MVPFVASEKKVERGCERVPVRRVEIVKAVGEREAEAGRAMARAVRLAEVVRLADQFLEGFEFGHKRVDR